MFKRLFQLGSFAALALMSWPVFAQQSCESLTGLNLFRTTVTSAVMVPAGPFSAAAGRGNAPAVTVPAHCEVKGVARPTKDSEIKIAVWLPANGWNGKYLQNGNGGWVGASANNCWR